MNHSHETHTRSQTSFPPLRVKSRSSIRYAVEQWNSERYHQNQISWKCPSGERRQQLERGKERAVDGEHASSFSTDFLDENTTTATPRSSQQPKRVDGEGCEQAIVDLVLLRGRVVDHASAVQRCHRSSECGDDGVARTSVPLFLSASCEHTHRHCPSPPPATCTPPPQRRKPSPERAFAQRRTSRRRPCG